MKNHYKVTGSEVIIYLQVRDGVRLETCIDIIDLSKAMELPGTWYAHENKTSGLTYIRGFFPYCNGKQKMILLHRRLFNNPPFSVKIDHINHNTTDNRRSCNLRETTNEQNGQNRIKANKNNKTSGIRGVRWDKQKKKWQGHIDKARKKIHVGYFEELFEAEQAVIQVRREIIPFSQEALQEKERLYIY